MSRTEPVVPDPPRPAPPMPLPPPRPAPVPAPSFRSPLVELDQLTTGLVEAAYALARRLERVFVVDRERFVKT